MNRVLVILAVLSTLVISSAGVILAQSVTMTASIPFNFSVGTVKLSAGDYEASVIGGSALLIRGKSGGSAASVLTMAVPAKDANVTQGKLIFTRYGNEYFLTQVFWPGYGHGRETFKSRRELELARNLREAKEVSVTQARDSIRR